MDAHTASAEGERTFTGVLRVAPFRRLWIAQVLSQTAQNGIHFVQLLLIDQITRSSSYVGLMILAFTLPAVLFSAVAGVFVDRFHKRDVLFISNVVRVLTAVSYIVALWVLTGPLLLVWVYVVTFFASAIGQFFAPAQAALIPALVERRQLLTANSLFNITMIGAQVVGLLVIFPLLVKAGQIILGAEHGLVLSFVVVALMYALAAWFVRNLPEDEERVEGIGDVSAVRKAWHDLVEGWRFIRQTPPIWVPIINLTMTAMTVMILAMLTPGFADRVLHVSREDAVYIFAPAGLGMIAGTVVIGHHGYRVRAERLSNAGLVVQGMVLGALGLLGWQYAGTLSLTLSTAFLSIFIGLGFAMIGIPAQTLLQARTPTNVRGRVFATQFLLANLVGIPPMLFAGTLADRVGIAPVVVLTALFLLSVAAGTMVLAQRHYGAELDEPPPARTSRRLAVTPPTRSSKRGRAWRVYRWGSWQGRGSAQGGGEEAAPGPKRSQQ
ncbi:MAG: MFS transporter [Ardenticatenia bacterium]|nr:MFS transporter [Ardenticatenia bacterium]